MDRLRAMALAGLLLLAALPQVQGGTEASPELEDPAGDQETTAGPLVVEPDAFEDVDILAAWIDEPADAPNEVDGRFAIHVKTTAPLQSDTLVRLDFQVWPGPASLSTSTADGAAFTLEILDGEATGVDGAAATADGAVLTVSIPKAAAGAVGGDLVTNITVATSRSDAGAVQQVPQDDQSGSDEAGPGSSYTLLRAAPVGGVEINITGGTIQEDGASRSFTGTSVTAEEDDAGLTFQYTVRNTGTDPDMIAVGASGSAGLGPMIEIAAIFELAPGESDTGSWDALLDDPGASTTFTLTATSQLGTSDTASATILYESPTQPSPGERVPYPAGLDFMTPAAEATGLDDELGDHAELFLLGMALLIVFILLFLMLFLRRTQPIEPAGTEPIEPGRRFVAATGLPAEEREGDIGGGWGDHPRGIELGVKHEPTNPAFGEKVFTTVIVRNRKPAPARLRVQLHVDGKPRLEESIEVPGSGSREVRFPWRAGVGKNLATVAVKKE